MTIPWPPKTDAEIQAGLRDRVDEQLVAAGGSPVDWDHDIVLPRIVTVFALEVASLYGLVQAIADADDPTGAQQAAVDDRLALIGTSRKPERASRVDLLLAGSPGLQVPSGSQVQGGGEDGRAKWYLEQRVEFDATGAASATFVCTVAGPTVAVAGSIESIVTPVAGWDSVSQPKAAEVGRHVETDTQALTRWAQSLGPQAAQSTHGLRAALLALDDVETVVIVENTGPSTATIHGFPNVPSGAIGVAIHPLPTSPDLQDEIGQLMHLHGPDATRIYGTATTVEVLDDSGVEVTYGWSGASDLDVGLTVRVAMLPGRRWSPAKTAIEDLISTWTLTMGEPARRGGPKGLETAIANALPGIAQVTVLYDGLDEDVFPTAVQIVRLTAPVIEEVPDGA